MVFVFIALLVLCLIGGFLLARRVNEFDDVMPSEWAKDDDGAEAASRSDKSEAPSRQILSARLQKALERQDFENAAKIRDQLKSLNND